MEKAVSWFLVILMVSLVPGWGEAREGAAAGKRMEVLGYAPVDYQGDRAALDSVRRYGKSLDSMATFSYRIDGKGNLVGQVPVQLVKEAQKRGAAALVMIHNYNGTFDAETAHQVLSNSKARGNLVSQVAWVIKKGGYAGINVDIEGIRPEDGKNYVVLLRELKKALGPQGYRVTASIPAKTGDDPGNKWSGGYDYKAIGQAVDRVMLMTYDEHWFGGSPGPVASLPWVTKVVDYALTRIPGDKLMLGIATYGYDWSAQGNRTLSYPQAMVKAGQKGAKVLWHDTHQVPYFTYYQRGVKHQVWFENQYSLAGKLKLVQKKGLAGIAIWRLGFEEAGFWKTIDRYL